MTAPVLVGPSPSGGGPTPSLIPAPDCTRRTIDPLTYLTTRERQVLVLVANGHTNWAIGRRLGLGEQTVKTRVTSILRKLKVADRTQAATVALRLELIWLDEINIPEGL